MIDARDVSLSFYEGISLGRDLSKPTGQLINSTHYHWVKETTVYVSVSSGRNSKADDSPYEFITATPNLMVSVLLAASDMMTGDEGIMPKKSK